MGTSATANTTNAVAIGTSAVATGGQSVSIGTANAASGNGAVAIGDPNVATGTGAVALGANNTATGQGAVAVGNANISSGRSSIAMGNTSTASAAGAVALGDSASAGIAGSVALGTGSVTTRAAGTYTDPITGNSFTTTTGAVSVGASGAERQITNVAPGTQSTDAVNVSQLKAGLGNLENQIAGNLNKAYAGTAAAMAAAGLRFDDRAGKYSAAAATGYYHGQLGVAVGMGGTSENGRWRVNGGVTISPTLSKPDFGAVMGVSHTFN
jgi:autotransporter adhesin